MKAMILAAGEGTRLRPLTLTLPKPMVPVGNIPLLVRTMALLHTQGIHEIAANLYHCPEAILQTFGESLVYSNEESLLGTAGGVKRLESFLDQTFLVLYGDNLYDADFAPLIEFHRANNALATIATFEAENPSACGLVVTDLLGRVTRFQEKPPPEDVFTNTANAGVYVLEPEVLGLIPQETVCDFGRDVFPALLQSAPGRVFATPLVGSLRDTGTIPSYQQANWDVLGNSTLLLGEASQVDPTVRFFGRNVIGDGVTIEKDAELTDCICWKHCQIGAGARLTRVILGEGVVVAPQSVYTDTVLVASER